MPGPDQACHPFDWFIQKNSTVSNLGRPGVFSPGGKLLMSLLGKRVFSVPISAQTVAAMMNLESWERLSYIINIINEKSLRKYRRS
jgi:hypothetical protein